MNTKFRSYRILAALLAACMLFTCLTFLPKTSGAACVFAASDSSENDIWGQDEGQIPEPETDPEEYTSQEILTLSEDGTVDVITCSSQTQLKATLNELSDDEEVAYFQPNYRYTVQGTLTNDAYITEQWALNNDGTFKMADEGNKFPVYDDPFDAPYGPGKWVDPWAGMNDWFNMPGMGGGRGSRGGQGGGSMFDWFFGFGASSSSAAITDEEETGGISASDDKVYVNSSDSTTTSTAKAGIDINLDEAWENYNGGTRETVIAMIDTGIDTSHEDFGDVFWTNEDEIAGNGIDDDKNGYIDDVHGWDFYYNNSTLHVSGEDSHGTHGAGSIAATSNNSKGISGIINGSNVKIMIVKALGGTDGSGTAESVINAIKYAEANGAQICNMSIGTTKYDQTLYDTMAASDMLFVCSAGNDSDDNDSTPSYPASFNLNNVISVANLQADGTLHASSNYGQKSVDIAVPGTYILSLTENNSYSYMTGTSMSAPIMSAAASMLYSYASGISLTQVRSILLNTAKSVDGLSSYVSTGGMLDLGAAMKYTVQNLSTLTGSASSSGSQSASGTNALASSETGTQTASDSGSQSVDTTSGLPFTDVTSGDNAYDAIKWLYDNKIMNGTSSTSFSPDAALSRAMTITILGRIDGITPEDTDAYDDVKNGSWYSGYVGWATGNGIVEGYGNRTFGPNDSVLSNQLGLILKRYAAYKGITLDQEKANLINGLMNSTDSLTRRNVALTLYTFFKA